MFYTVKIRKKGNLSTLLLTLAVLIAVAVSTVKCSREETFCPDSDPVLVIDPGHGGLDSGAVSVGGVKEKDINLAIALRLRAAARFCGVETLMSREDDSISQNPENYSEREELIRRTELANSRANTVLVSIHQNFYPTSQPGGSQVLYGSAEGSKRLGEISHGNLIEFLNKENRRLAAPAPEELYITSHAGCPTILVECGFMSNFSDIDKLCDGEYQTSLAAILMASFLQFKNTVN